jgi:molecular chaperone DnaJ
MSSKKDYYQILEISRSANSGDIKKAYLKLAKQYHPDANPNNPDAEKKFKEINEAYDVLKDEEKKSIYDQIGHDAFVNGGGQARGGGGFHHAGGGFAGADFDNIFGDIFGEMMGGRRPRKPQTTARGSDLRYNLQVTLEEAFSGGTKNVNFTAEAKCASCNGKGTKTAGGMSNCSGCNGQGVIRRQQGFFTLEQTCGQCGGMGQVIKDPCTDCNGQGRHEKSKNLLVNVPAGVSEGTKIRIASEGEAGLRGGASGDLYVFVTIKEHQLFKVDNYDLHMKLPISITTAALGGEVEVKVIEGGSVKLTIPAGTETGAMLKLKGKGMSKMNSSTRGDLYAHAYVATPKNLTKKQTELLQELAKEFKESDTNYKDNGFFSKMKNIWS